MNDLVRMIEAIKESRDDGYAEGMERAAVIADDQAKKWREESALCDNLIDRTDCLSRAGASDYLAAAIRAKIKT